MKKITLTTLHGTQHAFAVRGIKILTGSNYEERYAIMQSFAQYFEQKHATEYEEEKGRVVKVLRDDMSFSRRTTIFMEIVSQYDFSAVAKLTARSPLLHYAQICLEDLPYTDSFAMLRGAYTALMEEEVAQRLTVENDDISIQFHYDELTIKTLIKLLTPKLYKDAYIAPSTALSLYESIDIQCAIVEKFAKKGRDTEIVVAYDGISDKRIIERLYNMSATTENIFCIVNAHTAHNVKDIRDYYLCGTNMSLDCSDDEEIMYKIEMRAPYDTTGKGVMTDIEEYIAGKHTEKTIFLEKIL